MRYTSKLGLVGLILLLSMGGMYAQSPPSSLNTYAPPPNPVSQVTAAVIGNPGSGTFYYWVVPIYPIGKGAATSVIVRNTPNIFTPTNYVQINWPFTSGASGYDVLRTTTPSLPSTCTCAIALATAATSLNDTGLPGLAYTISTASGTSGYIRLNNQSYPTPRYDIVPPINLAPSTFTGVLPVVNGGTGSTGLTGAIVGTGSTYSGIVGNPLQFFRRQANLPVNGYEFATEPILTSTDYAFPPQSPRVVLVGGVAATISMNPCPLGVNGIDANHYYYISGGVGVAESVLSTGGTCTSGASSGTIQFTPTNAHNGAWTIQSATAGIQEAVLVAGSRGGVSIPVGIHTIRSTITIPGAYISFLLKGAGPNQTILAYTPTTGDAIFWGATAGFVGLYDMTIEGPGSAAATAGYLLNMARCPNGGIGNLYLHAGYNAIYLGSPSTFRAMNVTAIDMANNGMMLEGIAGFILTGEYIGVNMGLAASAGTGLIIQTQNNSSVAGPIFTGCAFGGRNGVEINDGGNAITALNEITFSNTAILGRTYGVRVNARAGSGVSNLKIIGGTYVASNGAGGLGGPAIYLDDGVHGAIFSDLLMEANDASPMIHLQGSQNVTFNNIKGANTSGIVNAVTLLADIHPTSGLVVDRITITACSFGLNPYGGATMSDYGVNFTAQAHTNTLISTDSKIVGNTQGLVFNATGLGNFIYGRNVGKPACIVGIRGSTWYTDSAPGTADLYEVCRKDAANNYAWATLY